MRWAAALSCACVLGGCTLERAEVPPLAGPSELGVSLTMTATPDQIPQDGTATSVVEAVTRDAAGRRVAGVPLEVATFLGNVRVDFGALSTRRISTNRDGRAAVTYYAPPPPPPTASDDVTVTVVMTPVGTNFANASGRSVLIRLLRPGLILPPNRPPTAELFFSPAAPREGDSVLFDGSRSTDDGQIVSFVWSFGDGGTGTGSRAAHRYLVAGTYNVVLTVTDDRGARASTVPAPVVVTAAADPVASFTLSPAGPAVGQLVTANASASRAVTGRSLTSFVWDFGDGAPAQSGATTVHTYRAAGSYVVVLTVTDNAGRRGTATQTLTVRATNNFDFGLRSRN
jgi:PKD repeat protein